MDPETSRRLNLEPKTALNELRQCIEGSASVARLDSQWRTQVAHEFEIALGISEKPAHKIVQARPEITPCEVRIENASETDEEKVPGSTPGVSPDGLH